MQEKTFNISQVI